MTKKQIEVLVMHMLFDAEENHNEFHQWWLDQYPDVRIELVNLFTSFLNEKFGDDE